MLRSSFVVARGLHACSPRNAGPLVARNAATLSAAHVDSEIFGNAPSYPSAGVRESEGLVGEADGSTLFLDEIDELPGDLQTHFLRFLDGGEYNRLGEARLRRADLRLVAATSSGAESLRESETTMDNALFNERVQQWANDILVWIGFGTLVGLLAKAIMPGRDPGGAVATLAMGIGGTVIGCGTLSYFYEGQRVTPISPLGLLVATGGAFIILVFYRLLGGYFFVEGDVPIRRRRRLLPRSRSRSVHYVDGD